MSKQDNLPLGITKLLLEWRQTKSIKTATDICQLLWAQYENALGEDDEKPDR